MHRNSNDMYSRSQNNVNVVYCNYKEANSSYNVITKCNLPQSLVIYLKCLFETLKKHVLFKIVAVVRSTNTSKFLNNAITVILNCNYTVIIL